MGSRATALSVAPSGRMRNRYEMVVTNDIYIREGMEDLLRVDALLAACLMRVEVGGCPHSAIREDASINLGGL